MIPSASLVPAVPSEVDHVVHANTSDLVGSRSQESIASRKGFYIDHLASTTLDHYGSRSQESIPSGKEFDIDPSVNKTPDTVNSRSRDLLPSRSESLLTVVSMEEQV